MVERHVDLWGSCLVWNGKFFLTYEALLLHLAENDPESFDEVESAWLEAAAEDGDQQAGDH